MPNPIVLLHGYGSSGEAFSVFRDVLKKSGRAVKDIFIGNYVTLNNEITVDDIAEGFNYSLRAHGMFGQPFDAIVHSTGMLVMRAWLTAKNAQKDRQGLLKKLIALAPATFGSPIAAKGRSLLGRIFEGNHDIDSPDFLNSGNLVLSNLELGSEYTWNLAHKDLIDVQVYGPNNETPYVFVFDGTNDYGTLARIFLPEDQKGSDGVVRWSGVALNTRKITLNLSKPDDRVQWSNWSNLNIPLIPIAGVNHNEILHTPPQDLVDLVMQALEVDSIDAFQKFHADAEKKQVVMDGRKKINDDPWQQFVVRARDSHGNPIVDYSISLVVINADGSTSELKQFEEDVHTFAADPSYRCFHVSLKGLTEQLKGKNLHASVRASTGTDLVEYQGYGSDHVSGADANFGPVMLDLSPFQGDTPGRPALFYPFTTTLIEIILNRMPRPDDDKMLEIFGFLNLGTA
jgi:pimeloyl-ACP methyl ester carboxylesterase